ncbi:hypothetical protein ACIQYG_07520 [Peribacillus sp. NPDC096622]|uniref:hypothetical protein n=1 Tax=Peribacillus sp. NPDC096622 TaxID=3364396 RepID=UPI0037F5B946
MPGAEIHVQIILAIRRGRKTYLSLIDVPATPSTSHVWFLTKCYNKVDWRGRYETPAGKASQGETPQAQAEEAPRTARGKRVPGAEIHVQIIQAIRRVPKAYLSLIDVPATPHVWFLTKCYNKVDWRGRYETPAGKARPRETPQAQAEEAPRTARRKRVPGAEIHVQMDKPIVHMPPLCFLMIWEGRAFPQSINIFPFSALLPKINID